MNIEKLRSFRDICLIILAALALGYIGAEFLLPAILPFLIAYVIAALTKKPADTLAEKCGMNRKFTRATISVLIMLCTVGGFIFAAVRLAAEAWELLRTVTEDGSLQGILENMKLPFGNILDKLNVAPELESAVEDAVMDLAAKVLSSAAGIVTSAASEIPKIILFILICAISTVYFAVDLEAVHAKLSELLPSTWVKFLARFKKNSISAVAKYARSYFLLMLLTFAMMLLGLTLIRVRYALLLSFIISVLDLLPVLGIGIILVPLGVLSLLTGSTARGVGLLVLYAVASVVKQIAEPRIVGKNLGIHPLLTLALVYIGYSLFGIVGLVVLPVFAVVLSSLPNKKIPPRSDSESASGSSETQA